MMKYAKSSQLYTEQFYSDALFTPNPATDLVLLT